MLTVKASNEGFSLCNPISQVQKEIRSVTILKDETKFVGTDKVNSVTWVKKGPENGSFLTDDPLQELSLKVILYRMITF